MNNYRDNYYGSLLDPLHGDIKLSEIEKWCISQPIFSRLRRVKQNTFLYYVFPSANHTRFEHSIGVMHLAGKIFDSCKENYATGQKKIYKYYQTEKSSFFNLNTLGEKEEILYQELRLAALLHDLGHGPMSHLFDKFAISKDAFLRIIENEPILKDYLTGFTQLIKKGNNKVDHELISCAFIFYLIDNLKRVNINNPNKFSPDAQKTISLLSAERIVKIIEPEFINLEDVLDDNKNNYNNFFSRIVTSFPIDADRMDYLLRDSYFSGVTYGIYDINRIFASFQAVLSNGGVTLVFKESGLDSMLRFIQSRSHLYNQVYFHKTNRAANTMLTYGTATKRNSKFKLLDNCETLAELLKFYIQNSDEYFLSNTIKMEVSENSYESEVIDELIQRKLFKRVYQEKIIFSGHPNDKIAEIEIIKDRINEKLKALESVSNIYAVADYFDNVTFKDSNSKSVLIAKKEEGKYTFTNNWKDINKEFSMSDLTVSMIRIYLRRNFRNSNEFEKYRDIVIETVKDEIKLLKTYSE